MQFFLQGLSALVLLAYPFAVYLGVERFGLPCVALLLLTALGLRVISVRGRSRELKYMAVISGFVGMTLIALSLLFKEYGWLTFYPVVVNLCMLGVFAYSLRQPQTIIERLARIQEPDLPAEGIRYTRRVTQLWCVFFILNACFALYTCFHSLALWTLYNGLISYLLVGVLLALEWGVRQLVRRKHLHNEL